MGGRYPPVTNAVTVTLLPRRRPIWHARRVSEPDPTAPEAAEALLAEACQRSPLVWVRAPGRRAQPVWSTWHDGAVALVVGGEEQPDPVPGDATEVDVVVRSKAARSRLLTFRARVDAPAPHDQVWAETAAALKGARLNTRDPDTVLDRWAASSRVLRLVPVPGRVTEQPGDYDTASGAMPPAPTDAVTVRRRPFHLGGRRRRR